MSAISVGQVMVIIQLSTYPGLISGGIVGKETSATYYNPTVQGPVS
jgi:hypothetical protein